MRIPSALLVLVGAAGAACAQPVWRFDPTESTLGVSGMARSDNLDVGPAGDPPVSYASFHVLEPGYVYDQFPRSFGAGIGPTALDSGGLFSQTVATAAGVITLDGVNSDTVSLMVSLIAAGRTLGASGWDTRSSLGSGGALQLGIDGLSPGQPCSIRYTWSYHARADALPEAALIEDAASAHAELSISVNNGPIQPVLAGQAASVPPFSHNVFDFGSGSLTFVPDGSPVTVQIWSGSRAESATVSPTSEAGNIDEAGSEITSHLTLTISTNPLGACCLGATCLVTTQGGCLGVWAGPDTTCRPAAGEAPACCPGDFNHNGQVTMDDLFTYLTAWFGSRPIADLDANGLSLEDIFSFLRHWFEGC